MQLNIRRRILWIVLFALLTVSVAFAQTTPQTSNEHFAEGNKFYRSKSWAKAIEHYTESIKMREENAPAYLMRGTVLTIRKEFDKAIADYTKAIALDPWEYLAYYRRGEAYEKQGKKELAAADKAEFKKKFLEKARPRTALEFYERAVYFADRGFWGDAIADYGDAIKLDPSFKNGFPPVTAYEKRAELYELSNQPEDALKDYESALAQTGTSRPQLNLKRANLLFNRNDLAGALADYSVLIASKRKNFVSDDDVLYALRQRAWIYKANKEYDKAIADYTEVLKLDSKTPARFADRAQAQYDKGDYEKAIRDYDQAIALSPKGTWFYDERGEAYLKLKETDKALADFSKAMELDPAYSPAYLHRALAYSNRGEYDKAIADYTSLLARYPKHTTALHDRAIAYFRKEEWDKALTDLNRAIELSPRVANYYNTRGAVYRNKEEWDKAIADYTQAIALDAKLVLAYKNRASVYRKQNKTAEAEADEKKVKELAPEAPAAPAAGDDWFWWF